MGILQLVFFMSVFLIIYTYLLYPVLLVFINMILQAIRDIKYVNKNIERRINNTIDNPQVAIVIAAFNEEKHIAERVENLLTIDYPEDKYKIYIGSDASDDGTNEILHAIKNDRLVFFDFKERRGKVSVINEIIDSVSEEIIILSDANTMFDDQVVNKLVRHFVDENVGAVCGKLKLIDVNGDNADGMYWKIENVLKFYEGRIGALLGANGANYAIRKSFYTAIPTDTIVDDFTIVMNLAENNHTVVYEPEAISIEEVAPNVEDEFKRRIRIGLGNYQALARLKKSIMPRLTLRFFAYISHKVFRWFVPHFMVLAFVSSLLLIGNELFMLLFIAQLLFYIYAFMAFFWKERMPLYSLMKLPVFIASLNAAFAVSFFKLFFSTSSGVWNRTSR